MIAITEQGSIRLTARTRKVTEPALTRSLPELGRELDASPCECRLCGGVATPLGQGLRAARGPGAARGEVRDEVTQLVGSTAAMVTAGSFIAADLALCARRFTRSSGASARWSGPSFPNKQPFCILAIREQAYWSGSIAWIDSNDGGGVMTTTEASRPMVSHVRLTARDDGRTNGHCTRVLGRDDGLANGCSREHAVRRLGRFSLTWRIGQT